MSVPGVYYQRSGSTNQILRGPALGRFLLRKTGRCWDRMPDPRVSLEDLDPTAIAGFRRRAGTAKRLTGDALDADDVNLIDRLRLTDGDYLTKAAIANAFFWAGEIESWGRGIDRVLRACRRAGTPEPEIQLEPGGLWFELGFSDDYLESVGVRRESGPMSSEGPGRETRGAEERPGRWGFRPSVVKESLATAKNGTQCQVNCT